jgi:hypothetical protein
VLSFPQYEWLHSITSSAVASSDAGIIGRNFSRPKKRAKFPRALPPQLSQRVVGNSHSIIFGKTETPT